MKIKLRIMTASTAGLLIMLLTGACSAGGSDVSTIGQTPTVVAANLSTIAATVSVESTERPAMPPTFTPRPTTGPTMTPTLALSLTVTPASIPITPTLTLNPSPAPETAADTPSPESVNGMPVESIVIMPEGVRQHVREIFAAGAVQGRDPKVFSKLGDSLIASPFFLTQFDTGPYNLGVYDYLQPAIDYYAGSYERYGVALRPGLHAWAVFDPLWANKEWCQANESLLDCELRLNNPSVLLILLGTNDVGNPPGFDYNMREVVEYTIDQGVVPVLVTKADRFEGPDNINNDMLRQIAADYKVPLLDFDLVADTIPGRGLQEDAVHLTFFTENDYTMPEAYRRGHGIHNLVTLMMLEAIRQTVVSNP